MRDPASPNRVARDSQLSIYLSIYLSVYPQASAQQIDAALKWAEELMGGAKPGGGTSRTSTQPPAPTLAARHSAAF